MKKPIEISNIRIITISGRIASGSTTLAKKLADKLNWKHIEGGEIIWHATKLLDLKAESKDTHKRADVTDVDFDKSLKDILRNKKHIVLETKLAGFNAQGIDGVFKVLVICNHHGIDQAQIRIDRLFNRESLNKEKAKREVFEREQNDIEKWRRLYAKNDPNWNYWDESYYDLVINTYDHNAEESMKLALDSVLP